MFGADFQLDLGGGPEAGPTFQLWPARKFPNILVARYRTTIQPEKER